jgi:hypothetical protein
MQAWVECGRRGQINRDSHMPDDHKDTSITTAILLTIIIALIGAGWFFVTYVGM